MAALLAMCLAGVTWTAYWILQFGLAPRGPVSLADIAVRVALIVGALIALRLRRDSLERLALGLAALAAGSTILVGLGLDTPPFRAARLLLHLLAYALGAAALARWFRRGPTAESRAAEA
jgi:hypothetical protein